MTKPLQLVLPLLEDRNREMAVLYAEGAGLDVIASCYGVTRQRVHQILQRQGVPMRRQGRPSLETA